MEILPQDVVIAMLAIALLCIGLWSVFAPDPVVSTGQVIYTETDSRSELQKAIDAAYLRVPPFYDGEDTPEPTEKFWLRHAAYEIERME
jgi:hypothetical protein